MTEFYDKVSERLIRYAKINTQSKANTGLDVSTKCQFDLAYELYNELKRINASNVYLDEKSCIVYANILANTSAKGFGLITHMDTAPDASGENVMPWILKNYDGKDVLLNKEKNIIISPKDFPNLLNYIGSDIIFTDGTTLLGGDDKAGIAAVMTFAEYIINHDEIKHGLISIAFTPDEEVGGLAKNLDFKRFNVPVAYTLDGDHKGYYSFETFNALEAQIKIKGLSVHTGTAKGIMKNAITIATDIMSKIPLNERPENTCEREGFYHPVLFEGTCEEAYLRILIRDFDKDLFNKKKEFIECLINNANKKYNDTIATITWSNGYPNMGEYTTKVKGLVKNLIEAIKASNITPIELPFRGGTDGSSLSSRGLPCPNLSAGYENAHGRFEYVPIDNMEDNVRILIELAKIYAKEA
ncbi:MAG: peptidase T [Acholeplasmatales bacterium]|nr:peptidase T [Acholeplasmatales bacterium]